MEKEKERRRGRRKSVIRREKGKNEVEDEVEISKKEDSGKR